MATTKKAHRKHRNNRRYLYPLIALVVIIVAIIILQATNTTHFFHKTGIVSPPAKPITSLPTQPATTKTPVTSPTINQGTANDENGQPCSGAPTNSNQWATSSSGAIVLKLPTTNTTIQTGDTICGTATASPVQYRLIDNQVGVIAQGQLNVVNSNFSATINFTPHGSGGQLDVFNTDPNTGVEINEVQIQVNF